MKLFKKHKKIWVSLAIMSFLLFLAGSITPAFAAPIPTGSPPTTNSGTDTTTNTTVGASTNTSTNTNSNTNSNSNQINLECSMLDFNCKIEEFLLNMVQGAINYSVQQLDNFI